MPYGLLGSLFRVSHNFLMAVADSNPTRSFRTTHWSVVRMIGGPTEEQRRVALATLAGKYWYPVYSYIRRDGCKHHDAQDLTQGFFEQILERGRPIRGYLGIKAYDLNPRIRQVLNYEGAMGVVVAEVVAELEK